ncbi:hypothetical protein [Labilithrix luteola]|uniref:hypothetical protein n=1 Tax=Labilithrix luteola TaxID=1391654 RepID=UPI0014766F60|nr:hypothetical protein [Labilithrix luteola]
MLDEEASALRVLALASLASRSARPHAWKPHALPRRTQSPYAEHIDTALKKLTVSAP